MGNVLKFLLRLILKLVIAVAAFFVVTFTVYFFNLDMKLTSLIEPFLSKHFDTMSRDTYL